MTGDYRIFIDTGGTFTDCIAIDENGKEHRQKVLSSSSLRGKIKKVISETEFEIENSWNLKKDILHGFLFRLLKNNYAGIQVEKFNPSQNLLVLNQPLAENESIENQNFEITSGEEAPVLGIRLLTQTSLRERFPKLHLKLGSTKGTNALLENKGAKTLFVVTKGFADLLEIGDQSRPDIFALNVIKRKPLTSKIIEVDERIDAKGKVLKKFNAELFRRQLEKTNLSDVESVAVVLMNAFINPDHEKQIEKIFRDKNFEYISVSHKINP